MVLFLLKLLPCYSACSQKLAAWQLESEKQTKEKNKGLKACLKTKNYSKHTSKHHNMTVNTFDSPYNCSYHTEKQDSTNNKKKKYVFDYLFYNSSNFVLCSSHLSRLTDTTHLITNLASRATQSSYIRKSKPLSTVAPSETNGGTIISTITSKIRPNRFNPNRFKTGGIVATAVQPSKRTRKHHHHHHQHQYPSTVAHSKQAQPQLTLPLPITKHFDTDTEASNVKEFVKKVRTKMKKKKGKATGGVKA